MRLDVYLVSHDMVSTRSKASDLIKRGFVLVDGKKASKSGIDITHQKVEVLQHLDFVGRAGEKLYHAIERFGLIFEDKIVVDIGASTGGFTECALNHDAQKVYTYDVGRDQLADKLRQDQRVIVSEGTNILDVDIPSCDMILIDVSFISITKIFYHLRDFQGEIVALIKPQFEAGKKMIKQGVVKDKKLHKTILEATLRSIDLLGFQIIDLEKSEIKGKKGNQEYMIYIDGQRKSSKNIEDMIGAVL
ncbi:TlyA family RNA methyltransferase [Mycoplasmatota bacterium]|nr:TlyA family RNA methyltransferase [Mycoplasmatota bacterium]